jgi:branched-chain amino acid transport system ATP-binding protein
MSVLLVEQNLALGLSLADRSDVLNKGQIVHHPSAQELFSNDDVKLRYLGV